MDDQDIGSYKVYILVADDKGAETEYDILIQVDIKLSILIQTLNSIWYNLIKFDINLF